MPLSFSFFATSFAILSFRAVLISCIKVKLNMSQKTVVIDLFKSKQNETNLKINKTNTRQNKADLTYNKKQILKLITLNCFEVKKSNPFFKGLRGSPLKFCYNRCY